MKKFGILGIGLSMFVLVEAVFAQRVAEISYITAEGNPVVLEKTWATAFVQTELAVKDVPPEGAARTAEFKMAWAAKIDAVSGEILLKDKKGSLMEKLAPEKPSKPLPAGFYDAEIRVDFGIYGKVGFKLTDVEVKDAPPPKDPPKGTKPLSRSAVTKVRLIFNLPLVKLERTAEAQGGQAYYEALTYWSLDKKDGNYIGYAKLFPPGEKDPKKMIQKKDGSDRWGKAAPGLYDFLVNTDISFAGRAFDVRVLNVKLEPNMHYKLHLVMNGALVTVSAPKAPHAVHFYQPGTASQNPKPNRNAKVEVFTSEAPRQKIPCPPGTYDVLFNFDWGGRYEWKPNVRFNVGDTVELK